MCGMWPVTCDLRAAISDNDCLFVSQPKKTAEYWIAVQISENLSTISNIRVTKNAASVLQRFFHFPIECSAAALVSLNKGMAALMVFKLTLRELNSICMQIFFCLSPCRDLIHKWRSTYNSFVQVQLSQLSLPRILALKWKLVGVFALYLFFLIFIYNNFICKEHHKKGAAREELNPHIRQPPKQIRIKQI